MSTFLKVGNPDVSNLSSTSLNRVVSSLREGAVLRNRLADECGEKIVLAASLIVRCLRNGGKILFFGNGGSAADAQHLAAEFVGRFVKERSGLAALALTTDSSIITAVGNDYGFDHIFSRQIEALGQPGDIAVGISTSGNSPNVIRGIRKATEKGLRTIGITGKDGGALAGAAELALIVPSPSAARIQECHIAIGHILCELVDETVAVTATN
jgi:D-sedoheptulose 7-phosphate isomerase